MSDEMDAIAKAVNLNKKLAAKLVVRKEALEEAIASGRGGEAAQEELSTVRAELSAALKEVDDLRMLASKQGVRIADDSLEMSALDRARDDINALAGETTPPVRKPSKEEADAAAAAEFEALKAGKPKTKKTM